MPEFFANLWDYLWAVFSNWIIVVTTASPFVLDDVLKRVHQGYRDTLEKWVSAKTRRKWEIGFLIGGFVVANFLAFDGEHTARTKAEADNQMLSKQMYALSPSGQLDQINELKKERVSDKIAFSEIELKQQQEIDFVKQSSASLAPRTISDADRGKFISELTGLPKGPVAVITISTSAEVINFANKLRSLLDDAGYADPDKKSVTYSLASFQSTNAAATVMAVLPDDTAKFGGAVQNALKSIGIPSDGTIDKDKVLGLKPGEVAVIVLAR